MEKSVIVIGILDAIRESSNGGGFVKQDTKSQRWFEVGDRAAREKIGQHFRAALSEKSTKRRRKLKNVKSANKSKSCMGYTNRQQLPQKLFEKNEFMSVKDKLNCSNDLFFSPPSTKQSYDHEEDRKQTLGSIQITIPPRPYEIKKETDMMVDQILSFSDYALSDAVSEERGVAIVAM